MRTKKLKTALQVLSIIASVLIVAAPYQALAVDSATRTAIDNDAPFYDARNICTNQDTSLPTDLNGNDNMEKAFRYFTGKGLSAKHAAAIIGNLQQESGINPTSNQSGGGAGRGIAQWSVDGRWLGVINLAKEQKKSEWDLGVQLDFIWQELHGPYSKVFADFVAESDMVKLVTIIATRYEIAGKPQMPKRIQYANKALLLYGDTAVAPQGTGQSNLYMIGDSITDGLDASGIDDKFKTAGWKEVNIDASTGRSITSGGTTGANTKPAIEAIQDDSVKIKAAGAIFIGLGTNPGGKINQSSWGADIDRFIDAIHAINSGAPIYWLNVISPGIQDKDGRNKTLADHAVSKGFKVIDGTTISLNFDSKRIHPTDYAPLRDLVFRSIQGNTTTTTTTNGDCSGSTFSLGQSTKYIDGFTIYSQYDPAWKDKPYGTSTIGASGCGPSAMAMVVTMLTGKSVTPPEVATYASSMYREGQGSSWGIAPFVASHYELKAQPIGLSIANITSALVAGSLIVTAGDGADPFTRGGHYIVIRAATTNGKWKVADSAHNNTSDKEWDPQQLIDSMRGHEGSIYAISK